jgi:hypothetical protein
MSRSEDCVCKPDGANRIEYYKINGSRIELRCGKCNRLVTWWMDRPSTKKTVSQKRKWFEKERRSMR